MIIDNENIKVVECILKDVEVLGVDGVLFHYDQLICLRNHYMMTSSNGNIFRVTSPLCGEFTGPKASDAEFWCFLWSASE